MKRIFNDKIRRHKCQLVRIPLDGIHPYQSDACVPKLSEKNIRQIREIRS